MSMKKETKIQQVIDATQAAEFFHALGKAIAWSDESRFADLVLPPGGFDKIKITLKKEGEGFVLKAKFKEALEEEDPDDASYKALKTRMKGSFAELKETLSRDVSPRVETVRQFLDDSSRMLTFPGRGDEHYGHYRGCCREFEKTFESGDLAAMRSALVAVEACKKACHAQYK